jgi:hypothetical protein
MLRNGGGGGKHTVNSNEIMSKSEMCEVWGMVQKKVWHGRFTCPYDMLCLRSISVYLLGCKLLNNKSRSRLEP